MNRNMTHVTTKDTILHTIRMLLLLLMMTSGAGTAWGEDIDDLMTLCEADITSKNEVRKKLFLENFRMVREKLADLKAKDYVRLLQPVIDGNEIMELFHLKPSREVGVLKQYLKDAVLDNKVENERESLMALLMEKAKSMGLFTGV